MEVLLFGGREPEQAAEFLDFVALGHLLASVGQASDGGKCAFAVAEAGGSAGFDGGDADAGFACGGEGGAVVGELEGHAVLWGRIGDEGGGSAGPGAETGVVDLLGAGPGSTDLGHGGAGVAEVLGGVGQEEAGRAGQHEQLPGLLGALLTLEQGALATYRPTALVPTASRA
ncbi:hypothetical protein OG757_19925 [Streptomyces sp. NBC_01262]|nr:hypothetical protein [Streptomyces sp. NBC_01262]